jgi:hypothetical protein
MLLTAELLLPVAFHNHYPNLIRYGTEATQMFCYDS